MRKAENLKQQLERGCNPFHLDCSMFKRADDIEVSAIPMEKNGEKVICILHMAEEEGDLITKSELIKLA